MRVCMYICMYVCYAIVTHKQEYQLKADEYITYHLRAIGQVWLTQAGKLTHMYVCSLIMALTE